MVGFCTKIFEFAALTLFPKLLSAQEFDSTLAAVMPYSAKTDDAAAAQNRGVWGLQGSRRADCLPLWTTLQVLGRDGIQRYLLRGICLGPRSAPDFGSKFCINSHRSRYVDDSNLLTQQLHASAMSRLGSSSSETLRIEPVPRIAK